jgi:hypothetical protein
MSHDADDRHHNEEGGAVLAADGIKPLGSPLECYPEIARLERLLTRRRRWQGLCRDRLLILSGQLCLRLRPSHAGSQPAHHTAEEGHPATLEKLQIGHRPYWQPDIDSEAGLVADERRGGNAHDRTHASPRMKRAPDNGGVLLETFGPEFVADDGSARIAVRGVRLLVVTLRQEAPDRR